ncbi:MAG: hypothetical protein D3906_01405, partial [Candidatus Electrothrix sp. AUS1_2]|nr:hypothetical protein [Candidatus Electrothrix sp. AUS1_2]
MKNTAPRFCQVSLQDINLADRSYSLHTFHSPPEPDLLESISNFGILHPPLLLEKQNRSFVVLSGRKRIEAYLQITGAQAYRKEAQQKEKEDYQLTALVIPFSGE